MWNNNGNESINSNNENNNGENINNGVRNDGVMCILICVKMTK